MPSAQAGSGPSGTEGGAGCSRQGPSPRCFSSSERGAWSKRGRALAPINLAVSQECPLLDLCNVSFFQRYFKGRLCSSRAVDLCVLTCQPPDSGRPQPVSAPSPPHTLWSASPPSTSVSAVGAAVVPQGPRARGAIRMPRARGPLLCLLGTALNSSPRQGFAEEVSSGENCLPDSKRAHCFTHRAVSWNTCCTWVEASKISTATGMVRCTFQKLTAAVRKMFSFTLPWSLQTGGFCSVSVDTA